MGWLSGSPAQRHQDFGMGPQGRSGVRMPRMFCGGRTRGRRAVSKLTMLVQTPASDLFAWAQQVR